MIDIDDYMKLSQQERQRHLRLDEDCIMRGGQSMYLKGLLAHIHGTTIPSGRKVYVCHACHNELCSNPNHLYWGTPSENCRDAISNGRKNLWEAMVEKYGEDGAKEKQRRGRELAAKAGRANKGKTKKDEHKAKISLAISNLVCYTDGKINIKQHKDLPPPKGFKRGMTRKKIKS